MKTTLFTIVVFLMSVLYAGQIEFERFTIDDGLSQNSVYEVFQDNNGYEFKQDDSLGFISDGLPEATNHTEHMLGYQAVQDCVKANGHQNANDQKQAILDLGSAWLGDLRNQDDITIVVVKKT
jgi:serine phosphatase RsbU (regulator of sigma subunit)